MITVARWQGALVAALFAGAVGLYAGSHTLFVLATVPLSYAIYGVYAGLGPPSLTVHRELDADHTDPGEPVTVAVTVENRGERTIPDLRVMDDVPEDVPVVEGSPGACVALRPGEATTVEYDLLPPRGTHEFGDVVVRGRSLAGTVVGTATLSPSGAETVTCDTLLDDVPLREQTTLFVGRRPTTTGGAGVEFHTVREYRRGDPLSHVDWRRLARTGDLATVSYREEKATAVVFVIDDRSAAAVRPPGGGPSATDLAVYAASRGLVALTDAGHQVGVTTLDPSDDGWVEPGRGAETEAAATALLDDVQHGGADDDPFAGMAKTARRVLATDGAGASEESDGDERADRDATAREDADDAADGTDDAADGTDDAADGTDDAADGTGDVGSPISAPDGRAIGLRLAARLPTHAQVVLCTPLADELPLDLVETVLARGHEVTVLSPDVTTPGRAAAPTPGQAVSSLARDTRLTAMRRLGVPATDWDTETPLQVALAAVFDERLGGWHA